MRLFVKKPMIIFRKSPIIAYTGNTNLAILLNKDTFEPDPLVLVFRQNSTNQCTWGIVLLIVRALLRRPTLTSSIHIHNVVEET